MNAKEKLLKTAERLFIKKGYDGVSVRELTDSAGVNVAAVNYHYGGKRNLYRAFFKHRLTNNTFLRLDELEEKFHASPSLTLREIIKMFVSSFLLNLLTSEESERFLNLISFEMTGDGIATDIIIEYAAIPVHKSLKKAIKKQKPDMKDMDISLCISSINSQIFHFVRAKELIMSTYDGEYDKEFIDKLVEHITDFSLNGINGRSV